MFKIFWCVASQLRSIYLTANFVSVISRHYRENNMSSSVLSYLLVATHLMKLKFGTMSVINNIRCISKKYIKRTYLI